MSKAFILLGLVSLLEACAASVGSPDGERGIRIVQFQDVHNCHFISDIHGLSPFYGIFAAPALKSARKAAIERAAELGATHVVWDRPNTTYGSTSISGNAYKCK
jgi:hypothetical protein